MNNGSQDLDNLFGRSIPPDVPDDNLPPGISDMVTVSPSTANFYGYTCKVENKGALQHKNDFDKNTNLDVPVAPAFLNNIDPSTLPGIIDSASLSEHQLLRTPNSINDFRFPTYSKLSNASSWFGSESNANNGPVDIRKMPCFDPFMDGSVFSNKKRKSLLKSSTRASDKLLELGVSQRMCKLEKLLRVPSESLTRQEKKEKKQLIRLERNRRAAAVSRERKKRYIKNLEGRNLIMSKHLEALERENSQLRMLLDQCSGSKAISQLSTSVSLNYQENNGGGLKEECALN